MSDIPPTDTFVVSASPRVDRYKRSFVTRTVCELKFPTLLELAERHPPAKFVSAIRQSYPTLEAAQEVSLNLGQGTHETTQAHIFRALKGGWVATLKHSSMSIEGQGYDGYPDLRRRVKQLIDAALPVIDAQVWTRVGLRFINTIACDGDPVHGWVNPELVAPILSDNFTKIGGFGGALQLGGDERGAVLRHQLQLGKANADNEIEFIKYILDIDEYQTAVPIAETFDVLDKLHTESFNFFDWCLGEKARDYLMEKE